MSTENGTELVTVEVLNVAMKNVTSPTAMYDDFRITMGANFNWEQLLSPAPLGISVLGDLMVVASTMSDFRLDESGKDKQYKFMRYPESFRASLVQISNSGYRAFMLAHTNMDQLRLYSAHVPSYMKEATKILMSKNAKLIPKFLPTPLERIREAAEQSVTLSMAVTKSFEDVTDLTGEILEALIATKGLKEQQNEETRDKMKILETTSSETEKMLKDAQKHKGSLEKTLEETQNELREARNKMPSGIEIFAMSMIENFSNIVTLGVFESVNRTSKEQSYLSSSTSSGATMTVSSEDECLQKYRQNILTVFSVAKQLFETSKSGFKKSRLGLSKLYDGKTDIETLQNIARKASECHSLVEICNEGIQIIETLQNILKSDTPSETQEVTIAITKFRDEAEKLVNQVTSKGNVLPQRTPHMVSNVPTSGRASEIIAQAREHVGAAETRLKDVRQSAEKARDQMIKLNEEHIQQLIEMQRLKISDDNYKEAIELLQKGLVSLGKLKEHWSGLARFFSAVSNVVEVIMSKSMIDFNTHVQTTSKDLDLLGKVTLDLIYTSAMKASQASYFVHSMADTYTKVSDKFIMPNIIKLDQMIAFDPNKSHLSIDQKRDELLEACQRDSQGIIEMIMKDKGILITQAEERMNTIKDQFAILAIEDEQDLDDLDDY